MRLLFPLLALLLAGCADTLTKAPPGVALTRVWPGWRDADSFRRISEYFSGKENTGGEIVLRTHPEERAGYYFLVRVKNPDNARSGDRVVIQVIGPDAPDARKYIFPVSLKQGSSVFDIGVTGTDWPMAKKPALAWKIEVQNSDGAVLSSQQSFLWAKPEK